MKQSVKILVDTLLIIGVFGLVTALLSTQHFVVSTLAYLFITLITLFIIVTRNDWHTIPMCYTRVAVKVLVADTVKESSLDVNISFAKILC